MNLQGKRVLVVGLAQTGASVAKFCHSRGARVTVTDAKPAEALGEYAKSTAPFATLELGNHVLDSFTGADLIVMSPGVPELAETRAARQAGVPVIAEIELAYRLFHPESILIGITGTNGKSTTTALTGSICRASGRPTFCGGNLGNMPLIEAVDHAANSPGGLIVCEVAGFMLETCTSFRPKVAANLNITEDHLDRYGTMDVYASMKNRIYQWQQPGDTAVANGDDRRTVDGAKGSRADVLLFSLDERPERGAGLSEDRKAIVLRGVKDHPDETYPLADLPIIGLHNAANAMAAYLCARSAGVPPEALRDGSRAFKPEPHRMEFVGEHRQIAYYDDSKGTNVAAVAASLRGFPRPVVLIAGGVDKGGSYQPMFAAIDDVAHAMVLIGQAGPLIEAAGKEFGVRYPMVYAKDMHEAVARATELARAGDAVVLSPACSSYDMFKNYKERGQVFRAAYRALKGEAP